MSYSYRITDVAKMAGGGKSPLASYNWDVILPLLSEHKHGITGEDPDVWQRAGKFTMEDTQKLSLRVQNITIPRETFDIGKAYSGHGEWKHVKRSLLGTMTFEIMEFEDGLTTDYLSTWISMVHNPNNTLNPPAVYKRNIVLRRQSRDGSTDVITYNFTNAFISSIAEVRTNYSDNGIITYQVTLEGDGFEEITNSGEHVYKF